MFKISKLFFLISILLQCPALASTQLKASIKEEVFFNYAELKQLQQETQLKPGLKQKLKDILNTPIKGETVFKAIRWIDQDPQTKRKYFRVLHWNMERGFNLDALEQALYNSSDYLAKNQSKDTIREDLFYADVKMMKEAQIYSINEADFGMTRTGYLNTVEKFAEITKSKYYVLAPEFIEIDKRQLDRKDINKSLYKGIHANAIVSKFPILSTKTIPLPQCYNWFHDELKGISRLEKLKRKSIGIFVKQPIITELRRGQRNALVATIDIPNSPVHLTFVSTHFENRCLPKCRKKQIKYLLNELKDIDTPLVLAGDFNNSEVSAEPTSVRSILKRTFGDWQNLARATASWFNPLSYIINPAFLAINTTRKAHDPTVFGLPLFLRNKTADLFWQLINFEFEDKNMFDFSDAKELCYKGQDGKLANSNQRVAKGFKSTFKLFQNNILTHFRFDWIFVKSMRIAGCQDKEDDFEDIRPGCKNFIPAFGRNLRVLNESYQTNTKKHLSDHDPITCKILI